jgi:hypothetical protein
VCQHDAELEAPFAGDDFDDEVNGDVNDGVCEALLFSTPLSCDSAS